MAKTLDPVWPALFGVVFVIYQVVAGIFFYRLGRRAGDTPRGVRIQAWVAVAIAVGFAFLALVPGLAYADAAFKRAREIEAAEHEATAKAAAQERRSLPACALCGQPRPPLSSICPSCGGGS